MVVPSQAGQQFTLETEEGQEKLPLQCQVSLQVSLHPGIQSRSNGVQYTAMIQILDRLMSHISDAGAVLRLFLVFLCNNELTEAPLVSPQKHRMRLLWVTVVSHQLPVFTGFSKHALVSRALLCSCWKPINSQTSRIQHNCFKLLAMSVASRFAWFVFI